MRPISCDVGEERCFFVRGKWFCRVNGELARMLDAITVAVRNEPTGPLPDGEYSVASIVMQRAGGKVVTPPPSPTGESGRIH